MTNQNNPWERLMRWTLGQESCEIVALSDEPPTLAVSYDGDSDDELEGVGANFTEAAHDLCAVLERREMLPIERPEQEPQGAPACTCSYSGDVPGAHSGHARSCPLWPNNAHWSAPGPQGAPLVLERDCRDCGAERATCPCRMALLAKTQGAPPDPGPCRRCLTWPCSCEVDWGGNPRHVSPSELGAPHGADCECSRCAFDDMG